jgi:predicted RNA-binding Zn ribbon-like protein
MTNSTGPIAIDPPGPGLDPAIDFLNTFGLSNGQPFDELTTPDAAIDWLAGQGLLEAEAIEPERRRLAGRAGKGAIERLQRVRSGLREVVDALDEGRPPKKAAVAAVNDVLGLRESTELVPGPSGLKLMRSREGAPLDRALAEISRRIAAELDEGRPDRFRICANDRCRWVFYDRSRPGSRRWCEMSSCGNRAKAARHRARARARREGPANT